MKDVVQELVSPHPNRTHEVVTGRCWSCLLRNALSRDPGQHDTVRPKIITNSQVMAHYIYRNISFTLTKILAGWAQGKHPGGEETYLNVARLT